VPFSFFWILKLLLPLFCLIIESRQTVLAITLCIFDRYLLDLSASVRNYSIRWMVVWKSNVLCPVLTRCRASNSNPRSYSFQPLLHGRHTFYCSTFCGCDRHQESGCIVSVNLSVLYEPLLEMCCRTNRIASFSRSDMLMRSVAIDTKWHPSTCNATAEWSWKCLNDRVFKFQVHYTVGGITYQLFKNEAKAWVKAWMCSAPYQGRSNISKSS
jgi:hypothetical protein